MNRRSCGGDGTPLIRTNNLSYLLNKNKPAGEALRNTTVLASTTSSIQRFGIRAQQQ